jgi:hypothetical protein
LSNPQQPRCSAQAKLGSLDEIGTVSQKWKYEQGLLMTSSSSSSSYKKCLGPSRGVYELVKESYPLVLQPCPQEGDFAPHMKFVVTPSGLVQSLAPIVVPEELKCGEYLTTLKLTTPYCMTIEGASAMKSAGSRIHLTKCDFSNAFNVKQRFEPFGTRAPFLHTLQSVYGREDVLQLAFDIGNSGRGTEDESWIDFQDDDNQIIIDFYQLGSSSEDDPREQPVYSFVTDSSSSGIVTLNISELAFDGSANDNTIHYEAKFRASQEYSYIAAFAVATDEDHVNYTTSGAFSSSMGALGISIVSAACVVVFAFVVGYYYSAATAAKAVVTKQALPCVDKEQDVETSSQTTGSDHSSSSISQELTLANHA